VSECTLNNCTLTGNSASVDGGGAYQGTLNNCTLTANSASSGGGGAFGGTLNNCILTDNSAGNCGGGTYCGTLNNCTLTANSASSGGGGAFGRSTDGLYCTLNNCALTGNSAGYGGGASDCTLNNCTLTGNSAYEGGGVYGGTLNNCIVYYNSATNGANYGYCTFAYSCTTPLPEGPGNIDADPILLTTTHLSDQSPCIGRGSPEYASGVDIDGEPWLDPPCMGADQFVPGAAIGPLTVAIKAAYTNIATGFAVSFVADNTGPIRASAWDFGDGARATNQAYASHTWAEAGDYSVVFHAYNDSHPDGVNATVLVHVVPQPIFYAAVDSPNPLPPFTSWETAATNIQDAVDAAALPPGVAGTPLVLVTNGVYATGEHAVHGLMGNCVAVTKPLTLRSVNGPESTVIQGYRVPDALGGEQGRGDGAIRCVYLTEGARLIGFTLTNGHTRAEGDIYAEQSGGGVWCDSTNALIANCVIVGNSATAGGGACGGTLTNCTLTANSASSGGGAYESTLNNCTLTDNSAQNVGGGACKGTLRDCTLSGNSAGSGGGVFAAASYNCTLDGNSATSEGGGAAGGSLYNCTLSNNSAPQGGGAGLSIAGMQGWPVTLYNCTLTGNSAKYGGGAYRGTLINCIVYYNTAQYGANYYESTFAYSCTTPLPEGPGNIDADPLLASATHLSAQSPCIGRGNAEYASGVDIDGDPWLTPPCMGADQFVAGAAIGPLTVSIAAAYTNVAVGFAVSFVAGHTGPMSASAWDFGDGVVVSNRPYASHAWAEPGLYPVRLTGYNDTYPEGVSDTVLVRVDAREVHYVNGANAGPVHPYTNWAEAAVSIQEAIDAGTQIGRLVLVSDGAYASGGRAVYGEIGEMTNRVVVPEGVEVHSVNGPLVTLITGQPASDPDEWGNEYGAIRCVYVGTNAVLSGFTLTNGHTFRGGWGWSGGGAWCESSGVLTNCTLTDNWAQFGGGAYGGTLNNCTLTGNSALEGGGVCGCTLNNCTLTGNSASGDGGGAYWGTLNNCTLTANSAGGGGGASWGTLNNCTLTDNWAQFGGGVSGGTLNNCTLTGNSARENGGGAFGDPAYYVYCTLNNCTLTGNSARSSGGGRTRAR